MSDHVCRYCKGPLPEGSKETRLYCSGGCGSFYRAYQDNKTRVCLNCGKSYEHLPLTGTRARCCSFSCESVLSHRESWQPKPRICDVCGASYESQRKDKRTCDDCRRKYRAEKVHAHHVASGLIKNPGVGSGGAQKQQTRRTASAKSLKWQRTTARAKGLIEWDGKCTICDEFFDVNFVHVHHLDLDPGNNVPGNLKAMCIRCHRAVHRRIAKRAIAELPVELCVQAFEQLKREAEVKSRKKPGNPDTSVKGEGQSDLKESGQLDARGNDYRMIPPGGGV